MYAADEPTRRMVSRVRERNIRSHRQFEEPRGQEAILLCRRAKDSVKADLEIIKNLHLRFRETPLPTNLIKRCLVTSAIIRNDFSGRRPKNLKRNLETSSKNLYIKNLRKIRSEKDRWRCLSNEEKLLHKSSRKLS